MDEYDPAAILKNLRSKTPTRQLPVLPPRPTPSAIRPIPQVIEQDDSVQKENEALKQRIKMLEDAKLHQDNTLTQQVSELQDQLKAEKQKSRDLKRKLASVSPDLRRPRRSPPQEERQRSPPQEQQRSPPHERQRSPPQERQLSPPQFQRKLDLGPLMKLYRDVPDFPRPVLNIDFTTLDILL